MKLTVIVSVYKEPELLEDIILKVLGSSYKDVEILVVVDGSTNDQIEEVLSRYRNKIIVIYNLTRLGKVSSLNKATKIASGDVLLFLDNDVELPDDPYFLNKLVEEFKDNDIVEMPKEGIVSNFFSKVVNYDYLGGAIASFFSSKILGKNLFLCGSAFAIKRSTFEELGGFSKVVNEDWDLMLKAFSLKKKFSYPIDLKVKTSLPRNLKEWFDQRKRWSLGFKFWWIEVFKSLNSYLKTLPLLALVGIIFAIPVVLGFILWQFGAFSKFLGFILLISQHLGMNLG
ncbi:MAG: glycosyltransferase, partial [Brevinematia bacterium]